MSESSNVIVKCDHCGSVSVNAEDLRPFLASPQAKQANEKIVEKLQDSLNRLIMVGYVESNTVCLNISEAIAALQEKKEAASG